MAEELQFASRTETTKRKYEDQAPPQPSIQSGPRRPTGFSAPITPDSTKNPSSYNNVPPPMDEIQIAKQRAQEIAARIFNNAEAKRPRIENDDSGFGPIDYVQKPLGQSTGQMGFTPPSSISAGYGYGSGKKIEIPNGRVGVIIGKGGETIKHLQLQSGAKIQVTRDMDADPHSQTRMVELVGTPEQISKAETLINEVLSEAEVGGSGSISRRFVGGGQVSGEQFSMKVPNNKVGLIIGKGGETIKNMQSRSGARIQLIPLHLPPGDTSTERTVYIDGTEEQIESAKQLVNEVISENRVRNNMGGGYPQQGGYRPPQASASWAPPGAPQQQTGYGYGAPGAYPGQPPQQYNISQQSYPGYPQQQTGYDQTSVTPTQQTTTTQGGGYDYYSQQQQQQPSMGGSSASVTDNTGYNYSQPQAPVSNYNQQQNAYGGPQQGYSQDGYGGGYGQAQVGYDQTQQGYNSVPTYGTVANSTTQGGSTPTYGTQTTPTQVVTPSAQPPSAVSQQGYTNPQPNTPPVYASQGLSHPGYPPTSQPAYGTQPAQATYATQPGYGPPQVQKPITSSSVYGQTQPGYGQTPPVQQGYATQAGGAPLDTAQQRPPTASYGAAAPQTGYVQQPYGVSPVAATQPGYTQQQTYGESYGSYPQQAPAYSSDSTTPAGPVSQQTPVPKASPKS
ncbi:hypothetical protein GIB67_011030 [Kingdonia uniflora]|uniref:K Homology domain-containing protein n=1 Tax=Kingdonia uniflora TaxID=39325 RepID=A0A7J7L6I5_9MAGN|nr:hypothetical protein GIB67_011030 [Kingdonia uniflora]